MFQRSQRVSFAIMEKNDNVNKDDVMHMEDVSREGSDSEVMPLLYLFSFAALSLISGTEERSRIADFGQQLRRRQGT